MRSLVVAAVLLAGLLSAHGQEADLLQRAAELQQRGDLDGAVAAYRQFLSLHPNELAVRSNLGVLLSRAGRFAEAIAEYQKALQIEPGNTSVELNLGLAHYKSGHIPEAAREFSLVRQKVPDNQQTILLLADCDLQMGHNDDVISLLRPIEEKQPDDLAIAYLLGTALIRGRQVEEGQRRVDRILKNGDSAEARFLLGSQIFASGDFPAALKQFSRAIELNATLPTLQSFYGQALLNTGDPDAAVSAFKKELAANPNDFAANLYWAEILLERKQWDEARPLLTRALRVRPDSPTAKRDLDRALAHRDVAPASQPGLRVGDAAPDVILLRKDSGQLVSLRQLRQSGPVVLVFGSYTCPNFRASAGTLNQLASQYQASVPFYLAYVREAHSTDDWESTRNQREGVVLRPATNMTERQEHATICVRKLHIEFPALVDGMNGAAEKAYGAWPSRVYVIDGMGRIAFSSGLSEIDFKPDQLQAAIKKVSSSPQNPEALIQDAISKQRSGDLPGAVEEYREFLKVHPEATAIHSNLGAALAGLGRYEEAVGEYKTALKQSPSLAGVSLNLSLAYYKMGRVSEAVPELVKVHRQTPTDIQATLLLSDCYLRMGRNKEVIALLEPVQREHADDLGMAYLLGTALIRNSEPERGQLLVDRILRNGESAEAHMMLGSAKMQVRDFSGARDEFANAVALNPRAPEVHVLYAQALQVTGDPDGALAEFKAELAADPYNFDSNLEMGVLLRQDDKPDEALTYLTRALTVRPGDMGARYQIASIRLSQGKLDQARSELESIIKGAPQFTEAHVSLATVYYRLKRPDDGNRERNIVRKLTADAQAKQPGATKAQ